jgi:hypothetical protein
MKLKRPLPLIKSEPIESELTGAEIASHFSIGKATVRRWRRAGMPARGYNSRLFRYKLSEVEGWLQTREKTSAVQSAEVAK